MKAYRHFLAVLLLVFPILNAQGQAIPSKRDPARCIEIARAILSNYEKGNFTAIPGYFNQRLKEGLTPPKLEKSWKQMVSQLGPYKGIKETSHEMFVGSTIIYCVCMFGDWAVDFKTTYDGAGNVSGLFFLPHNMPSLPGADTMPKKQ